MRLSVALGLLLSLAGAASAATGSLVFEKGVRLEGSVAFEADRGVLDLAPAAARGENLSLRWARAEGELVTFRRESADAPVAPWVQPTPTERAPWAARNGTFSGFACRPGCKALLVAEEAGAVGLSGAASGPAGWAREERTYFFGYRDAGDEDSFVHVVEPGWLQASGEPGLPEGATRLLDARPHARGGLTLLLWNVTARVDAEDARGTLWTGSRESAGPGGLGVVRSVSSTYARLRLEGAELSAPPGSHALLAAPAAAFLLDGALDAPVAAGFVQAGERHEVRGEPLRVEGRLETVALARAQEGSLPPAVAPERPWPVEASFRGDVRSVEVGGRVVEEADAPSVAARLSLLALALLALAALARLASAGLAPLYTRIRRDSIFRNANRRRIFEAIRGQPSTTVAELQRGLGLTQVVVRHHVRILEGLGLVRGVQEGRRRSLFAVDGRLPPSEGRALVTLKDGTRKRIAARLAQGRPMTQRDLTESTGVSQRLVSYHLSRLEKDGLVRTQGSMPLEYVATPLLVGTLGVAAREPPAAGAGA